LPKKRAVAMPSAPSTMKAPRVTSAHRVTGEIEGVSESMRSDARSTIGV
jgi:hypothetical protein